MSTKSINDTSTDDNEIAYKLVEELVAHDPQSVAADVMYRGTASIATNENYEESFELDGYESGDSSTHRSSEYRMDEFNREPLRRETIGYDTTASLRDSTEPKVTATKKTRKLAQKMPESDYVSGYDETVHKSADVHVDGSALMKGGASADLSASFSSSSNTAFGAPNDDEVSDERRLQSHQDACGELYARLIDVNKRAPQLLPSILAGLARTDVALVWRTHSLLDTVLRAQGVIDAPFQSRFARASRKIERNWNNEFQRCQRALTDEEDVGQNRDKLVRLRDLANDFVSVAEHYGRIIISERYLPNEEKTIRPVSVGGVAGGEKFVCQGILFKFAVDSLLKSVNGVHTYMYGGDVPDDESAMRVAGNELRGVISYFRSAPPGLHVPLMCLIDYRGFRLVAASLLPLDRDTLCYGSNDGGATVHNSDAKMERYMRLVAAELNLKGHLVGNQKRLHACGDIEGHKGTDGKYYVIDLARVFPPQAPSEGESSRNIFHKLLRPELVKSNGLPLSSDAFSRFQKDDPRDKQLNGQVRLATKRLFDEVIPRWAKNLGRPSVTRLVEDVHAAGVNVRHLGLCRSCVPSEQPEHRVLLLSEMMARVVKNIIRFEQREALRRHRIPSLAIDRRLVLDILNLVFGSHEHTGQFWCSNDPQVSHNGRKYPSAKFALMRKFQRALTDEEQSVGFDLRWRLDIKLMLERLQAMTSITLSKRVLLEYRRDVTTFEITDGDLVSIGVKVKHMNIVGLTTAVVLRLEAAQQSSMSEFNRIFALAERTFQSTLASVPDNALTWHEWGKLLYERAKRTGALDVYEEAIEKFNTAEMHGANADDQVRTYAMVSVEYALSLLHEGRQLKVNSVANEPQLVEISNPEDWRESHRRYEQVSMATQDTINAMEQDAEIRMAGAVTKCPALLSLLIAEARRLYAEACAIEGALGTNVPLNTSVIGLNEAIDGAAKEFSPSLRYSGELRLDLSSEGGFVSPERTPRDTQTTSTSLRGSVTLSSSQPIPIGATTTLTTMEDVSALAALAGAPVREYNSSTPTNSAPMHSSLRDSSSNVNVLPMRSESHSPRVGSPPTPRRAAADALSVTASSAPPNATSTTTTVNDSDVDSGTEHDRQRMATSSVFHVAGDVSKEPFKGVAARIAKRRALRAARTKSHELSATAQGKGGMSLLQALLHNIAQILRVCVHGADYINDGAWTESLRKFLSQVLNRTGLIGMQRMNLRKFHKSAYDIITQVAIKFEEGIRNDPTSLVELGGLIEVAEDEDFLAWFVVYLSCSLLEEPVLGRANRITTLNISMLSGVPEGAFLTIFRECRHLEVLNLQNCWQVTNATIECLATDGSKRLRALNISGCHKVGDIGVGALAKHCGTIRELNVSYCDRISDISMILVAQNFTLTSLACAATRGIQSLITDMSIMEVAANSTTNLRTLDISCCERIGDRSLMEVATYCTKLENLCLERFRRQWDMSKQSISEKGLLSILKNCSELKALDVSGLDISKRWLDAKRVKYLPECRVRFFESG